jgi:hypothetical protein
MYTQREENWESGEGGAILADLADGGGGGQILAEERRFIISFLSRATSQVWANNCNWRTFFITTLLSVFVSTSA